MDWSPVVEERAEAQLRFIVRDGERVLQQLWTTITRSPLFESPVSMLTGWRDVPTETED